MSRRVVRSDVTYAMSVTLLTIQLPMTRLKAGASLNIRLYAHTQHKILARKMRKEGGKEGRTRRQVTIHGCAVR